MLRRWQSASVLGFGTKRPLALLNLGAGVYLGASLQAMNEITPNQLERHAETLELINSEVAASLARLSDSTTRVDTKAIALVGYAGAASSFLATRHAQPVITILAYIAFGMAAGFGIWAYGLRSYQLAPNPRWLFNEYWERSRAQVLGAMAATRVEVFESNARRHLRKVRIWWLSLASLATGMTLMIFALTSAYW